MFRFFLVGFFLLMSFDTLTQVSIKLATIHSAPASFDANWAIRILSTPWICGVIIGYIGAFITWMTLLKHAPIGMAFVASHIHIVSVLFISFYFLGEKLSITQACGALLIILGLGVLAKTAGNEEI